MDPHIAQLVEWGASGAPEPAPEPEPATLPPSDATRPAGLELARSQQEQRRRDLERAKREAEDASDELKIILPAMQRWLEKRRARKTHYKWLFPVGGAAAGAAVTRERRGEAAALGALAGFALGLLADDGLFQPDRDLVPAEMPVEVRVELAANHPEIQVERQLRWPRVWRDVARGPLSLFW